MLNALAANTSSVLPILAGACGVLILAVIVLSLRRRASRGSALAGLAGEDAIRRDLAEISRRLASLDRQVGQIVTALPRSVQGVGVVRYNPFPEMGGNMSFSLALLDGSANGVVISVLNDRNGSRVYGKAVENGASTYTLSDEEQQALAQARRSRR